MHENYDWDVSMEVARRRFIRKHGVEPKEVVNTGWAIIAGPVPSSVEPVNWSLTMKEWLKKTESVQS